MSTSINIQSLSLTYRQQVVFDHLSFSMPTNAWTVLLGPSGVGKSSLLRAIAGLPLADSRLTLDIEPSLLTISYLPQQSDLLPWLTVLENTLIGFRLQGKPVDAVVKEQAMVILQKVGLKNKTALRPNQLSGGMQQRVMLARVLLSSASLILMDEPFSGLDLKTRLAMQDLALELLSDKTVLLVTHDPLEAVRTGDAIYLMQGMPAKLASPVFINLDKPRVISEPALVAQQVTLTETLLEK